MPPTSSSSTPTSSSSKTPKSKPESKLTNPAVAAALGQSAVASIATLSAGQRRAAYVTALDEIKSVRRAAAPSVIVPAALLALVLLGPLAIHARRRNTGDAGA